MYGWKYINEQDREMLLNVLFYNLFVKRILSAALKLTVLTPTADKMRIPATKTTCWHDPT